ncbi:MAG: helix-turn-helix domain-containing protein [Paracoccus sp. (in: a-proteobacteria)]|nr:helix-turn-helix domain-containing protein [Paracoccus sp. (in: a-proteobacteria)]
MTQLENTMADNPLLMKDTEVARFLGMSKASVWRLTRNGKLPQPIRIGGMTRWKRAEIEAAFSDAA